MDFKNPQSWMIFGGLTAVVGSISAAIGGVRSLLAPFMFVKNLLIIEEAIANESLAGSSSFQWCWRLCDRLGRRLEFRSWKSTNSVVVTMTTGGRSAFVPRLYRANSDTTWFLVGWVPVKVSVGGDKSNPGQHAVVTYFRWTLKAGMFHRSWLKRQDVSVGVSIQILSRKAQDRSDIIENFPCSVIDVRGWRGSMMSDVKDKESKGGEATISPSKPDNGSVFKNAGSSLFGSTPFVSRLGYFRENHRPMHVKYERRLAESNYVRTPEQTAIVEDAVRWFGSQDWYRERGIPWQRGLLVHGAPGGGKSSLVKHIAKCTGMPIYRFHLPSMGDAEFEGKWDQIANERTGIMLLEDFDCVFEGRKNITDREMDNGIGFSTLLNCLDGVKERGTGRYLVITTNRPETLDHALYDGLNMKVTRPGRIDLALKVGWASELQRQSLVRRILSDWPDEQQALLAGLPAEVTMAQVQAKCIETAFALLAAGRPESA